jgi:hypothetical protein
MPRLTTINFLDTVAASSNKTLVSKRIENKFRVKRIRCSFALNTNRTLRLYFFVSEDPSAPTDEEPKGFNLLSQLGQQNYLVGDDEWKELPLEVEEFEKGKYVKIYAVNTDTYEHTIDAQVTLELGTGIMGLW